jgi:hypothetical protein
MLSPRKIGRESSKVQAMYTRMKAAPPFSPTM